MNARNSFFVQNYGISGQNWLEHPKLVFQLGKVKFGS